MKTLINLYFTNIMPWLQTPPSQNPRKYVQQSKVDRKLDPDLPMWYPLSKYNEHPLE